MTAFAININDLLAKRKVESDRIEFKAGWNPDKIYRTICAFANDFDNLGGGYILVGVEEENGVAVRPVKGISQEQIDGILKDMIGYNNKIEPYYMPRTMVEEVDGKSVLAIWVPSGENRPYSVPSDITSKRSMPAVYLRSGTSSIEAKGEILDQMRDMANRTPFHNSFVENVVDDVVDDVVDKLTDRQRGILKEIAKDSAITAKQLASVFECSERTIQRDIEALKDNGVLDRDGADNSGNWVVKRVK